MYAMREGKLNLAGFFCAKLRKHQVTWLPCDIEALSIAAAIKHFSPFIEQSLKQSHVLADSKPCVEAIHKLCLGKFQGSYHSYLWLDDTKTAFNTSQAQLM